MTLKLSQKGNVMVSMVGVAVIIALAVFSIWSYTNYLNEKNNSEEIIAEAVTEAERVQEVALREEFTEESKSPNKTYVSPKSTGSVSLTYPKTWSAFIDEDEGKPSPIDAIFHPDYVPADDTQYAMRMTIENRDYTSELGSYDREIEQGQVSSSALKVSGVTGVRLVGEVEKSDDGILVIFPLRDKTLKIWTESNSYSKDFNKVIDNLSFEP